jgi:transcriptional regulator with XRE-family HTH domain
MKTEKAHLMMAQAHSMLAFSELVCELIESRGITRAELSSHVGITERYLNLILNDGDVPIDLALMTEMIHALGYQLDFVARLK